jgi:salicylate hydroxylase
MRGQGQGRISRIVSIARTIVVAGAGIGGLTAALALAQKGFRVVVLEKAGRLEEAGAGLQLSPNASRILIELGLQERLQARAVTPDAISIISARSGGEIAQLPLGEEAGLRAGAPWWVLHRADLQAALLAQVNDNPDIDLRLGCEFDDVVTDAGGVIVTAHSDTTRHRQPALALIGADGVWSTVRQRLFPHIQPQFSGLIAWRGTFEATRMPAGHMPGRVQLWMGSNAHLVAYPISGGRQINIVAILRGASDRPDCGPDHDATEVKNAFMSRHWPEPARMMIGAVDSWRRWPLFTVSHADAWSSGPVALLGDAAHAMLPFAAQGAGMAIEDAAVLAKCLGSGDNAPAALKRYAGLRRARVMRVQAAARQNGKIYHLGGAAALVRDTVIRAIGGRRVLARQDWVYRWRA